MQQLRDSGKYLYVITGSHFDFAHHVASYAIGEDWKELFDIVIFFARKPSFFIEERPFWRLDGPKEVEAFAGWEDLETGDYYSQGNWKDMNEFFEYCTEWEPCSCLYFGDNVLQVEKNIKFHHVDFYNISKAFQTTLWKLMLFLGCLSTKKIHDNHRLGSSLRRNVC